MKKTAIINGLLMLTVLTLLVLLASRVRLGATADTVAVLRTAGMTCSSCSDRITQILSREKGIAGTEVDVAGGRVMVGYDSKLVAPETLAQKVSNIGFGSRVVAVMSPEQYRQLTGRQIWKSGTPAGGCGGCGQNGGCGTK